MTCTQLLQHLLDRGSWFTSAIELDHDQDGEALRLQAEQAVVRERRPEPTSAMSAARRIHLAFDLKDIAPQDTSVPWIAAIIEAHAEPLKDLLRASKREHLHLACGTWYCCGACPLHENDHDNPRKPSECDCGANEWNAKVDEALGEK